MDKNTPTQKTPVYVDYKNVAYLRHFINPHGRMFNKGRNEVSAKHQRTIANAIKRARFMGLMPYVAK